MNSFLSLPHGNLIFSNDFKSLAEDLSSLPKGSLVKFDADNTLVHPEPVILRDPHEDRYKQLCSWYNVSGDAHAQAPYSCVDEFSVPLVRSLREREMCVIVFTAVSGRHPEYGDVVPDWRSTQLERLGFEFSDADQEIAFKEMDSPEHSSIPLFKKGILYSARRSKGDVFEAFFNKRGEKFPHIVLIDDAFENLVSVSQKVSAFKIPFTGVYYTKAWESPCFPDPALASRQVHHFGVTGKWESLPPVRHIEELEV